MPSPLALFGLLALPWQAFRESSGHPDWRCAREPRYSEALSVYPAASLCSLTCLVSARLAFASPANLVRAQPSVMLVQLIPPMSPTPALLLHVHEIWHFPGSGLSPQDAAGQWSEQRGVFRAGGAPCG